MKKSLVILCVLVVLSAVLTGCKKAPDLRVFNTWITDNEFIPGMSQKSLLYKISSYTYLGKNLTPDEQFQGESDEGYSVGSSFWGMNSNTTTTNGTVHAYQRFYVCKNLDNLEYPGGVMIGDSKKTCLEKLDLTDKRTNVDDIKIGNKTCEISLNENLLIYTENYDRLRDDGKTSEVTRTVMLKFAEDALSEVSVTISEKYPE